VQEGSASRRRFPKPQRCWPRGLFSLGTSLWGGGGGNPGAETSTWGPSGDSWYSAHSGGRRDSPGREGAPACACGPGTGRSVAGGPALCKDRATNFGQLLLRALSARVVDEKVVNGTVVDTPGGNPHLHAASEEDGVSSTATRLVGRSALRLRVPVLHQRFHRTEAAAPGTNLGDRFFAGENLSDEARGRTLRGNVRAPDRRFGRRARAGRVAEGARFP